MKQIEAFVSFAGDTLVHYQWWRPGGLEIVSSHIDALKESAIGKTTHFLDKGYFQGELYDEIRMTDDDENCVEYSGWWEVIESN